jgi:hypothetical protein
VRGWSTTHLTLTRCIDIGDCRLHMGIPGETIVGRGCNLPRPLYLCHAGPGGTPRQHSLHADEKSGRSSPCAVAHLLPGPVNSNLPPCFLFPRCAAYPEVLSLRYFLNLGQTCLAPLQFPSSLRSLLPYTCYGCEFPAAAPVPAPDLMVQPNLSPVLSPRWLVKIGLTPQTPDVSEAAAAAQCEVAED